MILVYKKWFLKSYAISLSMWDEFLNIWLAENPVLMGFFHPSKQKKCLKNEQVFMKSSRDDESKQVAHKMATSKNSIETKTSLDNSEMTK